MQQALTTVNAPCQMNWSLRSEPWTWPESSTTWGYFSKIARLCAQPQLWELYTVSCGGSCSQTKTGRPGCASQAAFTRAS